MSSAKQADVLIVGGGPAGSTLAWALTSRGVRTTVLERTRFPREKVCGDYVDPRGVRILRAMGALESLERSARVKDHPHRHFVDWERHFNGPIPFYGTIDHLPPFGYTIPREELDTAMLQAAARAGATVHEDAAVSEIDVGEKGVEVLARRGGRSVRYRSKLLVGADGANSIVARSQGLSMEDVRRTAVARRAYARIGGPSDARSEKPRSSSTATRSPATAGCSWLGDGRVNLGVGILSEARARSEVRPAGPVRHLHRRPAQPPSQLWRARTRVEADRGRGEDVRGRRPATTSTAACSSATRAASSIR